MSKYKPRPYYPPTSHDFIYARRVANLTPIAAAELLHVTEKTIKNWESGNTTIPYAAYKLLRIMTNFDLPSKGFEGWCIRDGCLWSPANRRFAPHELGYISNMFAMARYWIAERELLAKYRKEALVRSRQHLKLIVGGKL